MHYHDDHRDGIIINTTIMARGERILFLDRIRIRIIFGIRILTEYEYKLYSFLQNEQIRIQIIFVQKYLAKYEYE